MSEYTQGSNSYETFPVIRFAAPDGEDALLVGSSSEGCPGVTSEDRLLSIGKDLLGRVLTPNFGWGDGQKINYVADPIDPLGYKLEGLSRLLYEQRWLPSAPNKDEEAYIVHDLDEPAVKIVSV